MSKKSTPEEPPRSPIHFGAASNGEFMPQTPRIGARADRIVHDLADQEARRHGIGRRDFLRSPAGMAAALLAINEASGCSHYQVDRPTVAEPEAAKVVVSGDEFVFDCQTHHVDATEGASWVTQNAQYFDIFSHVSESKECKKPGALACLSREIYMHEVFVASDTTVAMLSSVPSPAEKNPLANTEMQATRAIVDRLARSQRLLVQGVVHPNEPDGGVAAMHALDSEMAVAGWKVYTPFDPTGGKTGFWLDDQEHGLPFLERVAKSRAKTVFLHKGLPWPIWDAAWTSPRDIGPSARQVPGVTLVVYHSGYDQNVIEGAFDPEGKGVDRLIRSCADAGIGKGGNVYAELGGTWFVLMKEPVQAAHVIGKLLAHFGEDRLLWGTDSLFLGSPQSQLAAFRAFEIPVEMQEKYGYPAVTPAVKHKILGSNAARLFGVDPRKPRYAITDAALDAELHARKAHALVDPPHAPPVYGPRSRREMLAFLARRAGQP